MRKEDIQKKKIFFNLKSKGIADEYIQSGIENLNTFYNNSELASALIFAKKKKILDFKKQNNDQQIIKKKLLKMAQAGFCYRFTSKN